MTEAPPEFTPEFRDFLNQRQSKADAHRKRADDSPRADASRCRRVFNILRKFYFALLGPDPKKMILVAPNVLRLAINCGRHDVADIVRRLTAMAKEVPDKNSSRWAPIDTETALKLLRRLMDIFLRDYPLSEYWWLYNPPVKRAELYYKFRPSMRAPGQHAERHRRLIVANGLWFSEPGNLNDKFDCRPRVRATTEERMQVGFENMGMSPERRAMRSKECATEAGRQQMIARGMSNFGVCCLSKSWDEPLMWAHYAQNSEGYAVGFLLNRSALLLDQYIGNRLVTQPLRVRYRRKRPMMSIDDVVGLLDDGANLDTWVKAMSVKTPHWKHEREWRFVGRPNTDDPLAGVEIVEIILGTHIGDDDRADICRWSLERKQRRPIRIIRARLPVRGTKLRLEEMPYKLVKESAYSRS